MSISFAKLEWVKAQAKSEGPGGGLRAVRYLLLEWAGRQVFRHQCPDIEWGRDVGIAGKLAIRGRGRVVIGDGCSFVGASDLPNTISVITPESVVTLGAGTSLNGATIVASDRVDVGEQCTLGPCVISDSDFHPVDATSRIQGQEGKTSPVAVGNRVWLARGVMVLKGVTVGDEAVVGAGVVLRSSVPPHSVVGDMQRVVRDT